MEIFNKILYVARTILGHKHFFDISFGGWFVAYFADYLEYINIPFAYFKYLGVAIGLLYLIKLKWR